MGLLVRLCALWLLAVVAFGARAEVPVPPLKSPVTDLTGTLSAADATALEQKLLAFEQRKGSQIFVLILPTTQPETIEQYAIRVADTWKPGRKGVDDGALLVVAKDDRTLRIDTRYGLEGVLNDAISKRIVDDVIVPRFKAGDFAGGINAGVDWMIKLVDGESLPAPQPKRPTPGNAGNLEALFVIGFILVIVVGGILRQIIGRVPAAGIVGGVAGVAAWFIVGAIAVGVIAAVVAFVFSLAAGNSGLPMRGGRGGGWGGGFPGGGGGWSSGGGWGGGGGGMGGGGGASGRW
ncbi:MAG: YgcG family protein [Burkholderiales bacterium]|nr:YgcG family protein [Burkholderiales bacterium]